jgi:hypothetical protein
LSLGGRLQHRGFLLLRFPQARKFEFERRETRAKPLGFARRPTRADKCRDGKNENDDHEAKNQEDAEGFHRRGSGTRE